MQQGHFAVITSSALFVGAGFQTGHVYGKRQLPPVSWPGARE